MRLMMNLYSERNTQKTIQQSLSLIEYSKIEHSSKKQQVKTYSKTATALTGDPVPPLIFKGKPINLNLPLSINKSRLIMFS